MIIVIASTIEPYGSFSDGTFSRSSIAVARILLDLRRFANVSVLGGETMDSRVTEGTRITRKRDGTMKRAMGRGGVVYRNIYEELNPLDACPAETR